MSRIGKLPIQIPEGVDVSLEGRTVKVTGPMGSLTYTLPEHISLETEGREIKVQRKDDTTEARALHGLARTLVANMIHGVSKGFEKRLEIVGVGYRADVHGDLLNLSLGYSHPVRYKLPEGITVKVDRQTQLTVSGIDKQLVGQVAAEIRAFRKPEPYKGKGIKYADEVIRRKAGKAGKGAGG